MGYGGWLREDEAHNPCAIATNNRSSSTTRTALLPGRVRVGGPGFGLTVKWFPMLALLLTTCLDGGNGSRLGARSFPTAKWRYKYLPPSECYRNLAEVLYIKGPDQNGKSLQLLCTSPW